jgi:exonuclease VII large subunit
VRALVSAVRSHIEREYSDCWVEGEISNLRIPDSGHLYFTLKEESGADSRGDVPVVGEAAAVSSGERIARHGSRAHHRV